jgi:hypothetical protein
MSISYPTALDTSIGIIRNVPISWKTVTEWEFARIVPSGCTFCNSYLTDRLLPQSYEGRVLDILFPGGHPIDSLAAN